MKWPGPMQWSRSALWWLVTIAMQCIGQSLISQMSLGQQLHLWTTPIQWLAALSRKTLYLWLGAKCKYMNLPLSDPEVLCSSLRKVKLKAESQLWALGRQRHQSKDGLYTWNCLRSEIKEGVQHMRPLLENRKLSEKKRHLWCWC